MIILMRGHIRNSFNNKQLYNFIHELSKRNEIKIYIHTWNIMQTNISWRNLTNINIVITEEMIKEYFADLQHLIVKIIIDDEKKNKLVGSTRGVVSNSKMPKIGWKNMWYGKKRIIDEIGRHESVNEIIVNMRFDVFSNSNSFNIEALLHFVNNTRFVSRRNIFMFNRETMGIDNIYIGNFNTMFNLIYHFHYNLDYIILNNYSPNQEFLVFRENEKMRI